MGTRGVGVPPLDSRWAGALLRGDSIYRKMAVIPNALWFCVTALFLLLLRFIEEHVLKIGMDDGSEERCTGHLPSADELENLPAKFKDVFYQARWEEKEEQEEEEEEEEKSKFEFRFSFQNPVIALDDGGRSEFKFDPSGNTWTYGEENAPDVNVGNYRFTSEKDLRGFVRHPDAVTFCVEESYVGNGHRHESSALSCTEKIDQDLKERLLRVKSLEHLDSDERHESVGSCEWEEACNGDLDVEDGAPTTVGLEESAVLGGDVCLRSESEFEGFSSSESISSDDGYSVKDLLLDYGSDDILSEREPEDERYVEYHLESLLDQSTLEHLDRNVDEVIGSEEVEQLIQDINGGSMGSGEEASSLLEEESVDMGGEQHSIFMNQSGSLSSSDLAGYLEDDSDIENSELDDVVALGDSSDINSLFMRQSFSSSSSEEDLDGLSHIMDELNLACSGNREDSSDLVPKKLEEEVGEDEDDLESLWEHQDLIEQLKMEIKKAKATRLPTILEESEISKVEDLRSWKIDAKFLQENPMDDLQRLYKSYRERMRKFDILNYQKMYAIGLLHLKDPLQSINTGKPTLVTLFSENVWPCRRRKSRNDPTEKFLRELQGDLETIYVGQMCLSWEFLWWQYEKSQDITESNSHGGRRYNQVAGEFQQFQVMIQRFLEDEPFQGARIPNYVKARCSPHSLLQVPFVREDSKKGKMEEVSKGSKAITREGLNYIMENSIRVLWHFIKSDKDETPLIIKGLTRNRTELQDPSDFELMKDILSCLHKKEKKLKDLLRVGNCVVKKFKKPQEQRLGKDLFCSQVDMKLVSRVLEMSRITTEQLLWCRGKLEKITFLDRRLHRESSFSLFPC